MHFISNALVIGVVIAAAYALITDVPFFDKTPILWVISKIFGHSDGSGGANLTFAGLQWKWYAFIYQPVLMFAFPSLAKSEEKQYREGTRGWGQGFVRSIRFGLADLIMLIPSGATVALSIGCLWFTHQFFKGSVKRSTTYHAAYNSILVAVVFATLFLN